MVKGDHGGSEEQLLLTDAGNADRSWRLNFDAYQFTTEQKEKPPRGFQDYCVRLSVPGSEDNVAEYYQQQVEMLEGFNEMDALADRGFVPGINVKGILTDLNLLELFLQRLTNAVSFLYGHACRQDYINLDEVVRSKCPSQTTIIFVQLQQ